MRRVLAAEGYSDTPHEMDRWWQAFLRRFDLEHTFRLLKQTLGWTAPEVRTPQAADCWTWLVTAAHTQLRLARPLAQDLRRPWEKPAPPSQLTPARVRRGFGISARRHTPSPQTRTRTASRDHGSGLLYVLTSRCEGWPMPVHEVVESVFPVDEQILLGC